MEQKVVARAKGTQSSETRSPPITGAPKVTNKVKYTSSTNS